MGYMHGVVFYNNFKNTKTQTGWKIQQSQFNVLFKRLKNDRLAAKRRMDKWTNVSNKLKSIGLGNLM